MSVGTAKFSRTEMLSFVNLRSLLDMKLWLELAMSCWVVQNYCFIAFVINVNELLFVFSVSAWCSEGRTLTTSALFLVIEEAIGTGEANITIWARHGSWLAGSALVRGSIADRPCWTLCALICTTYDASLDSDSFNGNFSEWADMVIRRHVQILRVPVWGDQIRFQPWLDGELYHVISFL